MIVKANKADSQYEVLCPWAEVDPVALRGITPRITDLTGKAIGLFVNFKVASSPIQTVVEEKLKERFAGLKFSRFVFFDNLEVAETKDKSKFEEWIKGVDAVITAVGD